MNISKFVMFELVVISWLACICPCPIESREKPVIRITVCDNKSFI